MHCNSTCKLGSVTKTVSLFASASSEMAYHIMQELVEDVVIEGSIEVVREATHEMVDSHLVEASQYDLLMDMVDEEVQEDGPDLVGGCFNLFLTIMS